MTSDVLFPTLLLEAPFPKVTQSQDRGQNHGISTFSFGKIWSIQTNSLSLHSLNGTKDDPLAQLVEHNTFNVGVLGSNPKRITTDEEFRKKFLVFL